MRKASKISVSLNPCTLLSLVLLLGFLSLQSSFAQESDVEESSTYDPNTAFVTVDGIAVFPLRGVSAFPARERADAVRDRVVAFAADDLRSLDELVIEHAEDSDAIKFGETILVRIYDSDAEIEHLSRQILARIYLQQIKETITRLRTAKNEIVVIPNTNILNSNVVNYSSMAREQKLILHTTVGIGYDTPWRQVEALLSGAAARTEGLLKDPPPFVLQKQLGDFAVDYELNAYYSNEQSILLTYSKLHANIQDVFNEFGVQIMSPSYEADPESARIVPKERWFAAPAKSPE